MNVSRNIDWYIRLKMYAVQCSVLSRIFVNPLSFSDPFVLYVRVYVVKDLHGCSYGALKIFKMLELTP